MIVNAVWDLLALNTFPKAEQVASLLGIIPTGIVIYFLFKRGVDKTLYPEGSVEKVTAASPPLPVLYEKPGSGEADTETAVPLPPGSLPILIVDDDPRFLSSAEAALRAAGVQPVHTLADSREVLPFLSGTEVATIVLNLGGSRVHGTELLPRIKEEHPELPVIVVTGSMDVESAVACIKAGAFDYLIKPMEKARFLSSIKRALELRDLREAVSSLQDQLNAPAADEDLLTHGIVTKNRSMHAIFNYMKAIARSKQPVLITGETGSGKDLVARAIHDMSGCEGKFVAVNVAGLDDSVISDTLFGHRKGAYTGADQAREGLIVQAAAGTLFLDEIGDLTESSQLKLLRLLEEKEYYPLGVDAPRKTDARILCATHHNLKDLIAAGKFRKDLFYRLVAHHIHLPPLRERKEDIPLLVDHFLKEAAESAKKKKPSPPTELFTLLSAYHFPGNVRELGSMVFDAVMQHRAGVLTLDSFKKHIGDHVSSKAAVAVQGEVSEEQPPFALYDRFPTLKEADAYLVAEALRRSQDNQGIAALLLGISRYTLNKRLVRRSKKSGKDPSPINLEKQALNQS
ncbi:MAG: two-component system response regulator [Deltaproteobacteria bacterium]|nr:MAG: two-component system response regulator [Deltaproteobacteria bacterium]